MIAESFTLGGPAEVDISAPAGSITVEAGEAGTAEVTIDTRRPDDWRVSQSGDSITVSYEKGGWSGGGRAVIRAKIPPGSDLRIGTAAASVRVTVPLRRATVSSASGDVWIGPSHAAAVKTASGEISLGPVAHDANAKSASGDVYLASADGAASISTASGDIVVEKTTGPLKANSASGDISVSAYLGSDFDANTMSGDISLGLPSGRTVKLRATTLSGDVVLPKKRDDASPSDPTPISIKAKSVSGDIRLIRLD